jgi:hypothetical protein
MNQGPGTKWAEIGKGVGEIFGGGFAFTAGVAGVLTLPGVAAVVGSAALVAGGIANVKSGAERLGQALSMSSGSGSSGPQGTPGEGGATLKPGPHAKESIPAHRGRPTASEQKQVNELMKSNGCHTCGAKSAGTKSGNAVADHQPPQALEDPKKFYPHCLTCARKQGGETLQEMIRRSK